MAGFLGTNVSMLICQADEPRAISLEALREGAFSGAIDAEGKRFGWTGLGDMLDTDNFFLANCDSRFMAFSYRLDARKAPGSVVRLQLAEAIRAEEQAGKKVGAKRRKELKEEITERLLARSEFAPMLVDCIWDAGKGRLYLGSISEKIVERVLAHFKGCFGMDAVPLAPERDMRGIFSAIQNRNGINIAGISLQPMGSASLSSQPGEGEKTAIAVLNSPETVSDALGNGLEINKIGLTASADNGDQLYFSLDANLAVSGLKLPKAERGAGDEATMLINADICARVGDIVQDLARAGDN